jgi:hypothetical protein
VSLGPENAATECPKKRRQMAIAQVQKNPNHEQRTQFGFLFLIQPSLGGRQSMKFNLPLNQN